MHLEKQKRLGKVIHLEKSILTESPNVAIKHTMKGKNLAVKSFISVRLTRQTTYSFVYNKVRMFPVQLRSINDVDCLGKCLILERT